MRSRAVRAARDPIEAERILADDLPERAAAALRPGRTRTAASAPARIAGAFRAATAHGRRPARGTWNFQPGLPFHAARHPNISFCVKTRAGLTRLEPRRHRSAFSHRLPFQPKYRPRWVAVGNPNGARGLLTDRRGDLPWRVAPSGADEQRGQRAKRKIEYDKEFSSPRGRAYKGFAMKDSEASATGPEGASNNVNSSINPFPGGVTAASLEDLVRSVQAVLRWFQERSEDKTRHQEPRVRRTKEMCKHFPDPSAS
jgi:hypothetical protein